MQLIFENITGESTAYFDTLKSICGHTQGKSMIDLGSGNASTTRQLGFTNKIYLDIVYRDIGEETKYFFQKDILKFIETDKELEIALDVSISLDNIEHFYYEDAIKIIKWMEENSLTQIIFTPLGDYIKIHDKGNTDPDTHKSGWLPKDFEEMGWAIIVFPKFHPTLGENGLGAFFSFHCDNIQEEFNRVCNELKNKSWAK